MKAIYRSLRNLKRDYIIASIITPSLTQANFLKEKAIKLSPEQRRASLSPLSPRSHVHFLFIQNNINHWSIVQYLTNPLYMTSLSNWLEFFLGEDDEILLTRKKVYWIFCPEPLYFLNSVCQRVGEDTYQISSSSHLQQCPLHSWRCDGGLCSPWGYLTLSVCWGLLYSFQITRVHKAWVAPGPSQDWKLQFV